MRSVAYELNDTASMIDFIRHGLAIGLLPPSFVQGVGGIAVIPIRHHVPQFNVALASPANRRLGAPSAVPRFEARGLRWLIPNRAVILERALRALQPPTAQPDRDHDKVGLETDRVHPYPGQVKQARKTTRDAHGREPPSSGQRGKPRPYWWSMSSCPFPAPRISTPAGTARRFPI